MGRLRPGVKARLAADLLAGERIALHLAQSPVAPLPAFSEIARGMERRAEGAGEERPALRFEEEGAHVLAGKKMAVLLPSRAAPGEREDSIHGADEQRIAARVALRRHLASGR